MARGAAELSTKRAKVDEADEEEQALVRRKEEVVRLLGRARKGKDSARAKKELMTLCDDFETKNDKLLRRLPPELWQKILDQYLHQNDLFALAMTCRFFRDTTKDFGKKVVTDLNYGSLLRLQKSGRMPSHTLGWFRWVCDTFEILPGFDCGGKRVKGAVYEADLLNYAAFQGSVEILRWLIEEKGCKLNPHRLVCGGLVCTQNTGWYVGLGGSVKVLEYLLERGYEFDVMACYGAARGGHLEALKYLRGLDPPCPWDEGTCAREAWGGTCSWAAQKGHLEVLKFARGQDPPCPWSRSECRAEAKHNGHQHIVDWIDQREDESDGEDWEYSDWEDW